MKPFRTPEQKARGFILSHFGKSALAPFTGQDDAALAVFANAVELYCRGDYTGRGAAITAMRTAVHAMQDRPELRALAVLAIVAIYDWPELRRLLPLLELDALTLVAVNEYLAQLGESRWALSVAGPAATVGPSVSIGLRVGDRIFGFSELRALQPDDLQKRGLSSPQAMHLAGIAWSLAEMGDGNGA